MHGRKNIKLYSLDTQDNNNNNNNNNNNKNNNNREHPAKFYRNKRNPSVIFQIIYINKNYTLTGLQWW